MTNLPGNGEPSAWLAAIVNHSFDAILSKTLDGIITSWNAAAEQLFGYSAQEAIGQSITLIIPPDRLHEEDEILARLRRGESISHFETVRRHRSGRLIDIELSVSPVRDAQGHIIGASKIARDITERNRRSREQAMLVREMHHRIGNLLSVVQSLVGFSRRSATSVDDFARAVSNRIIALSSAHQLILAQSGSSAGQATTLGSVIDVVLKPYAEGNEIRFAGSDLTVGPKALTSLALLFHELATNAVKYGALSGEGGSISIAVETHGPDTRLIWHETGGKEPASFNEGFGSSLLRIAVATLNGNIEREWRSDGLTATIDVATDRLES